MCVHYTIALKSLLFSGQHTNTQYACVELGTISGAQAHRESIFMFFLYKKAKGKITIIHIELIMLILIMFLVFVILSF